MVVAMLLGIGTTVHAQSTIVPGQGFNPLVINNNLGSDPYAMSGVPIYGWLPTMPTMDSVRDRLWLRAEYLHWWTEGMAVPPLVTTSPTGTQDSQAGILGEPDTTILFGGREINDSSTSGIRFNSGFWLSDQGNFAIESEYFKLRPQKDGFSAVSDGTTILGRPFFDITNGQETALLIAFPNQSSGNISVGSRTELESFMLNGRTPLAPSNGLYGSDSRPDRVDLLIGYRYLKLKDELSFAQNITSGAGTVTTSEGFRTNNKFDGLQLGVVYQANFRRASLESMIRVAAGTNRQTVNIFGNSSTTQGGNTTNSTGGLLTQTTNIGDYQRKQFTMIPELGLTFSYRVTSCLYGTIGYTVVYYPNVVRAGDQIDRDVNPTLLDPSVPFAGATRPRFQFAESDYWAQGINLGAELRF